MNQDFKKIFQLAKQLKLLITEKQGLKDNLVLYIKEHPVRMVADQRLLSQRSVSFYSIKTLMYKYMPIILILALLVSGGASVAAENSLPGDALYPIKVNVNETLRGWLAVSSEAQAKLDAQLVERRLTEAEALVVINGRLNASGRAELALQLSEAVDNFETTLAKIEAAEKSELKVEMQSELESVLQAHKQILIQLSSTDKAAVSAAVKPILDEVRSRLDSAIKARAEVESQVMTKTGVEIKATAEGKLNAAEHKVIEVRDFISAKADILADTKLSAEAKLSLAQRAISDGNIQLSAGEYGQAFVKFQEAMRLAQEAKLAVTAEQRLEVKQDNEIKVDLGL